MRDPLYRVAVTALALILIGCGNSETAMPAASGSGPAAATPGAAPPLKQFEGGWAFDLTKTLALWQSQGVPAAQINQMRTFAAKFPLHGDLDIKGTTVLTEGVVQGEYQLFALHTHNQWLCGKAWHHEDRHDPGDMSKCYVRLEISNGDLHLSRRMESGMPNLNDPDLTTMPASAGTADTCQADAVPAASWSPWQTFVFAHGKEE